MGAKASKHKSGARAGAREIRTPFQCSDPQEIADLLNEKREIKEENVGVSIVCKENKENVGVFIVCKENKE